MPDNDQTTYGGYEDGQDWLDDIAIENHFLNQQGRDTVLKKGGSHDKKD
jgi:hypothetical protein